MEWFLCIIGNTFKLENNYNSKMTVVYEGPKIDTVLVDLDGTLLDEEKELPPENGEAVSRAVDRGVNIVLASGRYTKSLEPFVDMLGTQESNLICINGMVKGPRREDGGRDSLWYEYVPLDKAKRIIDYCDGGNCLGKPLYPLVFSQDGKGEESIYFIDKPEAETYTRGYRSHIQAAEFDGVSNFDCCEDRVLKFALLRYSSDEMDRIQEELEGMDLGLHCARTYKGDERRPAQFELMIMDKAKGLRELAGIRGVGIESIAAIGDGNNDIPMLEEAGVGIVMANGTAGAITASDYITEKDNDEAGFAEALDFILVNQR